MPERIEDKMKCKCGGKLIEIHPHYFSLWEIPKEGYKLKQIPARKFKCLDCDEEYIVITKEEDKEE